MKKKFKKCMSFALVLMMISGCPITGDNIVVSQAANLGNLKESGMDKTIGENEKITADADDLSTENIGSENDSTIPEDTHSESVEEDASIQTSKDIKSSIDITEDIDDPYADSEETSITASNSEPEIIDAQATDDAQAISDTNERAELELISSGTCGENLTWELTTDGTLTISGEGNMDDYSPGWGNLTPWYGNPRIYNVIIANSVTSIGDYAFAECQNITNIIIPNSVIEIGRFAFSNCRNLSKVIIPDSVNSIGSDAFNGCSELTNITLPNSITSIELGTFIDCHKLSEIIIPNSVTDIGLDAFNGCYNLNEIVIPDSVINIGDSAFSACKNLTNITLSKNLTSIEKSTFSGCTNLSSIEIPNGVTSIGDSAFSGCSNLNNISIPDGMSYIGASAFWNCSSLTDIILPNSINYIGENAFEDCLGLTSISLPNQMTIIEDYTFFGCSNLKNITIPEGITEIGMRAFEGCSSLNNIKLPDTGSSIGSYAFSGCTSLERITIPNGVSIINIYTFYACDSLKYVTIPKTVKIIDNYAFYRCENLSDVYYGGNKEEWSEIDKTYLNDATIHYNSTFNYGDLLIKEFTEWDEETQIASFSTGISYHIDENTDTSFLNSLDELLGQTVLVVVDRSEIGLLKGIYPVDKIVGNISEWDPSSITLNGTEYPAAKDYSFNGLLPTPDTTSICYLYNGIVVGVISAEEKTGILNEWNGALNEVTIDGTVYPVDIEDLSFLQSIHNWIGNTICYALLDGTVIEISLPDYDEVYTGKLESYDEESGILNFSDGESYFVSGDLEEAPSDYIGKWIVYTVQTSQDQGVHVTSLELVKSEMIVTMKINQNNVFYKEGQYSFDSENFLNRSDFEIPYTVTIENRTNANGAFDQLKEDSQFDVTINNVEIETPSGFNFGWLNQGKVQSIGNGTIIHAGDSVTAEGYIKPDIWYSPEELTNTYNVLCTVDSSSGENSSMDTITVTINYPDASTDDLEVAAAQALDEISDNIAMSMDVSFFNQNTTNRIADALLSIAIMAKAEPQDLEEALTEDLFDQVFGDWKLDTGASTYDVHVQIAVDTKKYEELIFEFRMHLTSFNLNGTDYGLFGSIDYSIVGGKGINDVPMDLRSKPNVGVISRSDVTAFCNAAYELAEREIKKSYDMVIGDGLNKVADIVFGQTVKQILEKNNTSFSDILFKIITTPGKSYTVKCPVDIYLYDQTGELKASIVNDQIEKESDSVELEVIGDTKVITIWDGAYDLKLVSNGTGDMDITVTEYAGINSILRVVDFYNIPLGDKIEYLAEVQPDLLINDYILVDNQSEKITPDQDETILEKLESGNPEEHVHVYGEPFFSWSEDNQTCTAVFTCESCDDEQKIECDITSETTDPTCTVDGKTVYTATVSFADKEYTDTKEKVISATSHTYEYTDNGDGTHTKVCTAGDDTATEPHTYHNGICTYCGSEESKEHVHEYGAPEFKWSEDYSTCTIVFTCEDGDDQQSIECEVTDEITDATCTEIGKVVYTAKGTFDGKEYTDVNEVEVPALGHTYGTPEFIWFDDYNKCTATFTCVDGDDQQIVDCVVTAKDNGDGTVSYAAVAEFNDESYSTEQVVDIQYEPDEKPESGEPTESEDNNNSGNSTDVNEGSSEDQTSEESASNVQTGDDSVLALWSSLIATMISAGVIVLLIRRKYTK